MSSFAVLGENESGKGKGLKLEPSKAHENILGCLSRVPLFHGKLSKREKPIGLTDL